MKGMFVCHGAQPHLFHWDLIVVPFRLVLNSDDKVH